MATDELDFMEQLVALLPRLWRFGCALTRCPSESEELVQATCERALSRWHQLAPGSRLDSWAFSIMHSIWKNELRSRKVRMGEGVVDAATISGGDNACALEARIELGEVSQCLRRLPEEQRAALLLVYVEGYSYREAADLMSVPMGTVMSRLSRGRLALADLMESGLAIGSKIERV